MIHTIHIRPEALNEGRWDSAKAVPETTAKWALFFPPFWLAWHRLFFELAIYAMLGIAALVLLFTPYALAALALGGLPPLYLYLEGNQLRRNALARQGHDFAGVADAPDEEMALAKYFDGKAIPVQANLDNPPRPVPVRDDDLSFGLFGGTGV